MLRAELRGCRLWGLVVWGSESHRTTGGRRGRLDESRFSFRCFKGAHRSGAVIVKMLPAVRPSAKDRGSDLIRSVLYVHVKSGKAAAVVDYYRRERVLETALTQPGCLAADIHVPLEEGKPLLVTALWQSPEAYQGWLDNPVRRTFSGELDGLVDEDLADTGGALYELAHAVTAEPAHLGEDAGGGGETTRRSGGS